MSAGVAGIGDQVPGAHLFIGGEIHEAECLSGLFGKEREPGKEGFPGDFQGVSRGVLGVCYACYGSRPLRRSQSRRILATWARLLVCISVSAASHSEAGAAIM